jgi:cell division protein FtsI/penicillin-binding protein 2
MNRKKNNLEPKRNSYNIRIFLLMSVIAVWMILIGVRLFNLQIISHKNYKALAENQHGTDLVITPTRGEIYLSPQGNNPPLLVATNLSKNMVYAIPQNVLDKKQAAAKLAPLLEMTAAEIQAKFAQSQSYVPLKKQLSDDVSAKIKALKLSGIYLEAQDIRFYPENNLASQVLGFVGFRGNDRVGQYGIEGKYEKSLAGEKGSLGTDTDPSGVLIDLVSRDFKAARNGDDIYLTIDPTIQYRAQEVIKKAVAEHQADSGSVVVLNPKTGEILAMANAPDFDPNNYGKVTDQSLYSNKIVSGDYEPGSIFKAITMAAAMNDGKVTPQTTYENTGSLQIDDKLIKNSDPTSFLGQQNMITVLDESLNTGAFFAQQQIGNESFKKYVEKFGFGKLIDFELPNQVPGNLENLNRKGDIFFATASYGQGITATPLQMVQAYGAIANGGKMMRPYVVRKIVHPDGSEQETKQSSTQVINSQTASALSAMLVDVIEVGHGKKAAVPGYYMAGKTGTAQVAHKDRSGYDPNRNIGSFLGFGPVDDPRFVILIRIDSPKEVKFAETTAAPSFGELSKFILNYLQIPPSRQ